MNLKKIAIGMLLIVLAMHLSGCVETDSLDGTYTCANDDDILDLYGGDKWELSGTEHTCGVYTVRNGELRLKHVLGVFIPLKIDGRDLIDPDGDRWVRD